MTPARVEHVSRGERSGSGRTMRWSFALIAGFLLAMAAGTVYANDPTSALGAASDAAAEGQDVVRSVTDATSSRQPTAAREQKQQTSDGRGRSNGAPKSGSDDARPAAGGAVDAVKGAVGSAAARAERSGAPQTSGTRQDAGGHPPRTATPGGDALSAANPPQPTTPVTAGASATASVTGGQPQVAAVVSTPASTIAVPAPAAAPAAPAATSIIAAPVPALPTVDVGVTATATADVPLGDDLIAASGQVTLSGPVPITQEIVIGTAAATEVVRDVLGVAPEASILHGVIPVMADAAEPTGSRTAVAAPVLRAEGAPSDTPTPTSPAPLIGRDAGTQPMAAESPRTLTGAARAAMNSVATGGSHAIDGAVVSSGLVDGPRTFAATAPSPVMASVFEVSPGGQHVDSGKAIGDLVNILASNPALCGLALGVAGVAGILAILGLIGPDFRRLLCMPSAVLAPMAIVSPLEPPG